MESQHEINKSLLDIISDLSVEVSKLKELIIINREGIETINYRADLAAIRIERLESLHNE